MRILDFNVSGQKLQKNSDCDFTDIVAGSKGYLRARFEFSTDWAGCKKVAVFISNGHEYPVAIINNTCDIPAEVLTTRTVKLYVIGRRPGFEIPTNIITFEQKIISQRRASNGND